MIRIVEDMRDVNIYLSLRKQVGWIKLDENQAHRKHAYRTYNRLCQRNYSGWHKNDALSDVCQGKRDIL